LTNRNKRRRAYEPHRNGKNINPKRKLKDPWRVIDQNLTIPRLVSIVFRFEEADLSVTTVFTVQIDRTRKDLTEFTDLTNEDQIIHGMISYDELHMYTND
jgi:hypothetical protein